MPNRLVYPELYPNTKLFDRFDESVDMVCDALDNYKEQQIVLDTDQVMSTWFAKQVNKTGERI